MKIELDKQRVEEIILQHIRENITGKNAQEVVSFRWSETGGVEIEAVARVNGELQG